MDSTNSTKLFQLLDQGKWEEALPLLKEYFSGETSNADKGRVYVMLAQTYMQAATEINNRESVAIAEVLNLLEQMDKKEKGLDDAVSLAEARKNLS